jgi:hypothetical protein
MSTDVSPLQAPRDTHTLSPIALMNHRGLKLPIDSTVEQMDNVVRANRQAPSKSAVRVPLTNYIGLTDKAVHLGSDFIYFFRNPPASQL